MSEYDNYSYDYCSHSNSTYINPKTGLPMVNGSIVDVGGNPYGISNSEYSTTQRRNKTTLAIWVFWVIFMLIAFFIVYKTIVH